MRPVRVPILVLVALLQLVLQPLVHASPCLVGVLLGTADCCCHGEGHASSEDAAQDESGCCAEDAAPTAGALADGARVPATERERCDCRAAPERVPLAPHKSAESTESTPSCEAAGPLPSFLGLGPEAPRPAPGTATSPPGSPRPLRLLHQVFRL